MVGHIGLGLPTLFLRIRNYIFRKVGGHHSIRKKLPQRNCETDAIVMLVCSAENVQEEQTAGEKVQGAWKKAGDKLTEWGILSPRLMLAGGGLFMTLSNWGLLPAVRSCTPPLQWHTCSMFGKP